MLLGNSRFYHGPTDIKVVLYLDQPFLAGGIVLEVPLCNLLTSI